MVKFWCREQRGNISHVVRAPAEAHICLQLSASRSHHSSRRANQTHAVTSVKWLELALTHRQFPHREHRDKKEYIRTMRSNATHAKENTRSPIMCRNRTHTFPQQPLLQWKKIFQEKDLMNLMKEPTEESVYSCAFFVFSTTVHPIYLKLTPGRRR